MLGHSQSEKRWGGSSQNSSSLSLFHLVLPVHKSKIHARKTGQDQKGYVPSYANIRGFGSIMVKVA